MNASTRAVFYAPPVEFGDGTPAPQPRLTAADLRRRELLSMTPAGRQVLEMEAAHVTPATFTDSPAAQRRRELLAMTPAGQAVLAAEAAEGAR